MIQKLKKIILLTGIPLIMLFIVYVCLPNTKIYLTPFIDPQQEPGMVAALIIATLVAYLLWRRTLRQAKNRNDNAAQEDTAA